MMTPKVTHFLIKSRQSVHLFCTLFHLPRTQDHSFNSYSYSLSNFYLLSFFFHFLYLILLTKLLYSSSTRWKRWSRARRRGRGGRRWRSKLFILISLGKWRKPVPSRTWWYDGQSSYRLHNTGRCFQEIWSWRRTCYWSPGRRRNVKKNKYLLNQLKINEI